MGECNDIYYERNTRKSSRDKNKLSQHFLAKREVKQTLQINQETLIGPNTQANERPIKKSQLNIAKRSKNRKGFPGKNSARETKIFPVQPDFMKSYQKHTQIE